LAKPAGSYVTSFPFNLRELLLKEKRVDFRSNEFRKFIKMPFGCYAVWSSRENSFGLFIKRPNPASVIRKSREMKPWDKVV